MRSCLYEGRVSHRRFTPREHAFEYRLFMVYLDLSELGTVFRGRWLWSTAGPAVARFARADHLGDPGVPLDQAVRDLVESRTNVRPPGPIRLLTHLRYFGYCFNPASFYYCFDETGDQLQAIVVEVNNTPWGERHCYVLTCDGAGEGGHVRFARGKEFHVSPFMPMDIDYDWRFGVPGRKLAVHMQNMRDGDKVFDATLSLEQRPVSGANLASVLVRFPFMTARVIAAIYWQAFRLLMKRTPLYTHPAGLEPTVDGGAKTQ